jgi:hypothetical protein
LLRDSHKLETGEQGQKEKDESSRETSTGNWICDLNGRR